MNESYSNPNYQNQAQQDRALQGMIGEGVAYGSLAEAARGMQLTQQDALRLRDEETKRFREQEMRRNRQWALELVSRCSPGASAASLISAAKEICSYVDG